MKVRGVGILILIIFSICGVLPPPSRAQLVERPLVTGRHVMVTSLEPLASVAGMRILQGGRQRV